MCGSDDAFVLDVFSFICSFNSSVSFICVVVCVSFICVVVCGCVRVCFFCMYFRCM